MGFCHYRCDRVYVRSGQMTLPADDVKQKVSNVVHMSTIWVDLVFVTRFRFRLTPIWFPVVVPRSILGTAIMAMASVLKTGSSASLSQSCNHIKAQSGCSTVSLFREFRDAISGFHPTERVVTISSTYDIHVSINPSRLSNESTPWWFP